MIVQEPVQAAIWHCLNHYAYQDAIFLAERLCSEVDTDESLFTLATCYYRSNQIHQAFWVLHSKGSKAPQCRFLLAKCAYELKKFSTVETALTNENFAETKHLDQVCKEFGDVACFALQLIANVCAQTERHDMAAEANKRALKLNPFLWQSFADLCNRGHKPDPKQIFQFNSIDTFSTCQGHNINSIISFGSQNTSDSGVATTTADTLNSSYNFQQENCMTPVIEQQQQQLQQQQQQHHQQHQQQQQQYQLLSNNSVTPNNASFRSGPGGFLHHLSGIGNIEDTPIICNTNIMDSNLEVNNINSSVVGGIGGFGTGTPYRKQFKYLSNITPSTPSFGFLPLSSPTDPALNFSSPIQLQHQQQQQQQSMLLESNDQKSKKLKGHHVVSLISRKDSPLQLSKPIFSQTGNITPRTQNTSNQLGGQNVRRSSRLSFSNYSVKENNKSANMNKFAAPRSPPRKSKQRINKMNLTNTALNEINDKQQQKLEKEKIETVTSATTISSIAPPPSAQLLIDQQQNKVQLNNNINAAQTINQHVLQLRKNSAEGLMALLRDLGEGYLQLSQYNCTEAIEAFNCVPQHHFFSSFVQSMVAKAHYEQQNYELSAKIFQTIHKNEPHRLHLMEIYSTVLWHLHREVTLSALAQDLIAQDKKSPITWCVSGNCFSLHKEHETAIKFFERAVQVDPDYAYSYTLLGHELVITEELDKAMSCFRTAILKDSRHYNAWFGIGTIYSKQERYNLAEIHFRQALKINPKNSVLMVHVGTMQYQLKKPEQALHTLNAAIAIDPKNPLCKFHRGSLYFQMGKHKEALYELEELKQILPKESVVYYLIGKIHKSCGNVDSALMHFSWATDLDPKGANNQIKDAFDNNLSQNVGGGGGSNSGGGGGNCSVSGNTGDGGSSSSVTSGTGIGITRSTPATTSGISNVAGEASSSAVGGDHTSDRSDDSTQLRNGEEDDADLGPDYDSDSY